MLKLGQFQQLMKDSLRIAVRFKRLREDTSKRHKTSAARLRLVASAALIQEVVDNTK